MNYRLTDKLTCNMFRKISSLQASVVTNILLNLLSGSSNGRKDTSRHLYPDRPEKEAHVGIHSNATGWACKPQPISLMFGSRNNKCSNFIKL